MKTAIDLYNNGNYMSALHLATCAVDGCAKKINGKGRSSYITFIRNYHWLIERFGGITSTSITNTLEIDLKDDNGKSINSPDLADFIYYVFCCYTAHCDEIPQEFQLFEGNAIIISGKTINLPKKLVFGLLAACAFNKHSADLICDADYYLSYDSSVVVDAFFRRIDGIPYFLSALKRGEVTPFPLKDWLGKEDEIRKFLDKQPKDIDTPVKCSVKEKEVLRFAELYIS